MKIRIDKGPPTMTGNTQQDLAAINEYLIYLREQMNYILELLQRQNQ